MARVSFDTAEIAQNLKQTAHKTRGQFTQLAKKLENKKVIKTFVRRSQKLSTKLAQVVQELRVNIKNRTGKDPQEIFNSAEAQVFKKTNEIKAFFSKSTKRKKVAKKEHRTEVN